MDITQFIVTKREALLIGDYNSYRSSLSRQLLASRKRLGRATPKREKFASKPITAEDIGTNHEFAHLLLLAAERAYAHAMHVKTTNAEDPRGITGETRAKVISRLSKAAKTAQELRDLLRQRNASKATEQELLEATAYEASLAGAEQFEKQSEGQRSKENQADTRRWKACLEHYSQARVIYAALSEKDKKEIYKELLANIVDPALRYIAYQAGISRTLAVPVVAKENFPRIDNAELIRIVETIDPFALKDKPASKTEDEDNTSSQELPSSITWRGRKAKIVDASIGQALANVTAAEARLHSYLTSNSAASPKEKAAAYDDVLTTSQDAADATKRATDELEKERVDEGDARMQDLRVTSLSVNYDLVSWRVGRNRILIGASDGMKLEQQQRKKPKRSRKDSSKGVEEDEPRGRTLARLRERIVLYDASIQSINSVKQLRGAMRDEKFVRELDNKADYFRALKCLNISYSHTLVGDRLAALALLRRAQDLVSQTRAFPEPQTRRDAPPTLGIQSDDFQALASHIGSLVSRTHAIVEMHTLESNSAIAAGKNMASVAPLVQRLNEYPTPGTNVDLHNLVSYPPKIEPVPIKPLFLDVAFNYIDYPGRQVAASTENQDVTVVNGVDEKPSHQQKRGWFGFGRS